MLSKQERRFIISPNTFSKQYRHNIRTRIRKKIEDASKDIQLCIENQSLTGIDVSAIFGVVISGVAPSSVVPSDTIPSDTINWDLCV